MRLTRVLPVGRRLAAGLYALRSWVILRRSGLFDVPWYELQTGVRRSPAAATWHYLSRGRRQGLSPSPLFEPEFSDPVRWRGGGLDPFARYLRSVPRPGRPVHPLLDDTAWGAPEGEDGERLLRSALAAQGPLPAAPVSPGTPTSPAVPGPSHDVPAPQVLAAVRASAARWRHDESLRLVERFTTSYDVAREAEFLRRWRTPAAGGEASGPAEKEQEREQVQVSVVLPCWNRAEQVVTAILSVQAQTSRSWELLVVDDGSSDGSADVVAQIAAEDPRVVLLRQAHAGVCAARNLALAHARGRYVSFLDADNEYLPEFLQVAVAAMDGLGLRAAYAILRADDGAGQTTYRTLEAGDEVLRIRNFVDLNVLVVQRELVALVGGFDDTLRRTVDYDLVLRLRTHTEIPLLPFLAVQYHHDVEDTQRITNREAASWVEVVQARAFVDWDGLEQREQVTGRTSVVAVVDRAAEPRRTWEQVAALLGSVAPDEDVEVVLVDNGSRRSTSVVCSSWALVDPRVVVVREPVDRFRALGVDLALPACSGDVVVVTLLGAGAAPGWLGELRAGLDRPGTVAVQPLLVSPSGAIAAAGAVRAPGRGMPARLLVDHPVEDARRGGADLPVPALADDVVAVRFADLVRARGLDPIYRNAWDLTDLSMRLAAGGGGLLCRTTAEVRLPPRTKARQRAVDNPVNRTLFGERWEPGVGSTPSPWADLGFRVVGWRPRSSRGPLASRGVDALLERVPMSTAVTTVHERPLRRRWAIKTGAPAGPQGRSWGDVHFAEALAQSLGRLGQEVVVDSRQAHERSTNYLDDVVLSLRGLVAVNPSPGVVSLCWVISHPDLLTATEARLFDRVLAASTSWAAKVSSDWGVRVEEMLQCTDPTRFVPPAEGAEPGPQALFVGNSRNVFRPVVQDALEAGLNLTLYGSRWEQFVGADRVSGTYVPNHELAALYGSCGVLLNDHWDDMRREGFLSNRLFDATATGARVITDDIVGTEVFGGLVVPYQGVDQLRELVAHGLDEAFPPRQARLEVAERVRREHSFDARARQLVDLVQEVEAARDR